MGIRDIGYRHWQGDYTSHTFRWWTIAKQGLRATVYSKMRLFGLLLFAVLAWAPYFFFGIKWYFLGGTGINLCDTSFGAKPDAILQCDLYTLIQGWESAFLPLFLGMIAAPLVSNDLRSNAMYIYLAKPIRRIDYIVGKLVCALLWIVPVTVLPSLFVWTAAMATSDKQTHLDNPGAIFAKILFVQTIILVTASAVALVASSFSKRWWVALGSFLGGYFVLWLTSDILQAATRTGISQSHRNWLLISLPTNFINFARHVFGRPAAPPPWQLSLFLLVAVAAGATALFGWRVAKMEVAE